MKKKTLRPTIATLLLLLTFCVAWAQSGTALKNAGFTLSGKIDGFRYPYIYFRHTEGGTARFDSCAVKDGSFKFAGKVDEPQMAFLHTNDGKLQKVFYIENVPLTVEGDAKNLDKLVIKGSKVQDDYAGLEASLKTNELKSIEFFTAADKARIDGDTITAANLEMQARDSYAQGSNAIRKAFIENNPGSPVSLQALMNWTNEHNYPEALAMFNKLDENVKKFKQAKDILVLIEGLSKVEVGKDFIDFTQRDVNGNATSLSSFKGKYVLVEFWASWCGPCRAENPNLRAAYLKYHEKGFNVLGVSLDDNEGRWKKAVEKDDLPWAQVSDLKGWQNAAAVQYGVRAIPANFLIDPNGKIVKKNLRGEELNKALAELFN